MHYRSGVAPIPHHRHTNDRHGRALAVVEAIEQRVGGHGWTYADVIAHLEPPIEAQRVLRWRELTAGFPEWNDDTDRPLVLSTLRQRARSWGQAITHRDIDTVERTDALATLLRRRPAPADPFAGLPTS